jgi:hypothetical protein
MHRKNRAPDAAGHFRFDRKGPPAYISVQVRPRGTWMRTEDFREPPMTNRPLSRFLGDTPGRVILKLLVLSFVVGVLLSALDLHPLDVFDGMVDFIRRLWNLGFEALGQLGGYFVLGAVVVVPVWIVIRLLAMGRRD